MPHLRSFAGRIAARVSRKLRSVRVLDDAPERESPEDDDGAARLLGVLLLTSAIFWLLALTLLVVCLA